jgi:hypothetical protein
MTINHTRLTYEIVTRLPQLSGVIAVPSVYNPQNYAVATRFIERVMATYATKTKQSADLNKSRQFTFNLASNQFKQRALPDAEKKNWIRLFIKPNALSPDLPAAASIISPEPYLLFLPEYNERDSYTLDEIERKLLDQAIIEAYREIARGGYTPCSPIMELQPMKSSGNSSSTLPSSQASGALKPGELPAANSVAIAASSSLSNFTTTSNSQQLPSSPAPNFFRLMPEPGVPFSPVAAPNSALPLWPSLSPGFLVPPSLNAARAIPVLPTNVSSDPNAPTGYAAGGLAILQKANEKLIQALGQAGTYNEIGFFNHGNSTQQAQVMAVMQQIKTNALLLAQEMDKVLSGAGLGPRTYFQFNGGDGGPAPKCYNMGGPGSSGSTS